MARLTLDAIAALVLIGAALMVAVAELLREAIHRGGRVADRLLSDVAPPASGHDTTTTGQEPTRA